MKKPITTTVLLALAVSVAIAAPSHAESLFRANASVQQESMGFTPASYFTQPIPKAVGDIVTIRVSEITTFNNESSLETDRSQVINENSSGIINRILTNIGITKVSAPLLDGVNTNNEMSSTAKASRTSELTDSITCQVVEVLPNGNLMVQGQKVVFINRDRTNLTVMGIVNPFFLDDMNTIASNRVGNFQLLTDGKGVISRQQSDGIYNKLYQFFQ
ncbi:MAG: flagellar basal body L-ring protein FlgH [Vampirovibrionales bacterium]|nr:flagellar basal body L-ring protein FlgH [Vampirovibrionales bacterium]